MACKVAGNHGIDDHARVLGTPRSETAESNLGTKSDGRQRLFASPSEHGQNKCRPFQQCGTPRRTTGRNAPLLPPCRIAPRRCTAGAAVWILGPGTWTNNCHWDQEREGNGHNHLPLTTTSSSNASWPARHMTSNLLAHMLRSSRFEPHNRRLNRTAQHTHCRTSLASVGSTPRRSRPRTHPNCNPAAQAWP